ncbi:hypothetical protein PYS60_00480 [Amygdalobacter indicium]|uniref:hypothetical protein n=1 Tax=Amygdalobacter indicium TaxID=3029272 RepID=UPI00279F0875|nr:hypothetical protein [Amygdalobacter indicium]WEG34437.1 hypothetical protein PYS60_00480 [Amygdalobacter indicium]
MQVLLSICIFITASDPEKKDEPTIELFIFCQIKGILKADDLCSLRIRTPERLPGAKC